ncbi:MAG: AAA family ATP:ADP antiporter [Planctomycetota bacterium]|jgi:AAA family ATP:ADP antiporter
MASSAPSSSLTFRLLSRIIDLKPDEAAPIGLGLLYYFFLLSGMYILRPIREAFGITWGTGSLPALFYGTVAVMLLINPLYSRLVAKVPRSRFIPLVYRGLILCLLGFYVGLQVFDGGSLTSLRYAFYIFYSVFNLFIVSIFWSLMSDLFEGKQATRVYGCIAVGGSLGGLFGSFLTSNFIDALGQANLLLIACVFLELASRCAISFNRRFAEPNKAQKTREKPIAQRADVALGGSAWAGMKAVFTSPYLFGIGLYVAFYGLSGTFAYFFQAGVVSAASDSDVARTRIFANIDLFTNLVTLIFQGYLFARLLKWIGPGMLLCLLPVYSGIGFLLLSSGYVPEGSMLIVFSVFQILRRAIGYGLKKPTQEVLFTVVPTEDKYKAKNLIDLVFVRTGDMTGATVSASIEQAKLGLSALAAAAAPVSLVWAVVGLGLGAAYRKRAEDDGDEVEA